MKENQKRHLEFLISEIDELKKLYSDNENYEVCIELVNSKLEFEKCLNGEMLYKEIKNSVEYVNSILSETLPKELKLPPRTS